MPTKQELYWADREQKFLMENLLDQKAMDNLIKETNIKALNDCQDTLYAWYGKYADAAGITVAEARKAAETADIQALAKKAKEYVKNKDFSPQANADMKLYNFAMKTSRMELLSNQLKWRMFEMTDQQERILENVLPEQVMKVLRRQSGILGKTLYTDDEMKKLANYITHTSYKGNTFSVNLWGYEQDMKTELDRLLRQSLTMGRNPAQSATQFARLFGRQQHEAERLIRTEAARVRAHARRDSFIKAGYQYFKWIPRGNPCERCLEKVKASEAEPFPIKGGDMPPLHPYCYCSTAPVERDEDILSKEQIDADFERNWAKAQDGDPEQRAYFEKLYQGQSKVEWNQLGNGSPKLYNKNSGGVSGAITDGESERAKKHANTYYGLVRKQTTDVGNIAKATGYSEKTVKEIKNYLFIDEHDLDGQVKRFDPDFAIAQSWERLSKGTPQPHDLTLLAHEVYEKELIASGMSQAEAHKIASKKYNYQRESEGYYDSLKKR